MICIYIYTTVVWDDIQANPTIGIIRTITIYDLDHARLFAVKLKPKNIIEARQLFWRRTRRSRRGPQARQDFHEKLTNLLGPGGPSGCLLSILQHRLRSSKRILENFWEHRIKIVVIGSPWSWLQDCFFSAFRPSCDTNTKHSTIQSYCGAPMCHYGQLYFSYEPVNIFTLYRYIQ